ncbi:hypothetical protein COU78_04345 [Candidatus Peregrinibacteria bacterium CG10_big_fil_rev_8_21_14_0_10_49_24]|nr:MAG: hypothetical protein COV83_00880 [Candidatus Peregrinibacteria bacterium CG11_big_fil_rev_8_21_14_0_20_49_14]PIR50897.1 MAG: hypothetical protein COU78_04345 [Candidatus Peregrinibacteria bacterium CG10_big_fil_rev_8_21_14_0_10_49_24]PJA67174.1 MAG: hypothetical protein CO157_06275 [Candidatus Peregrinibacteria bacterium CG_4_9_14_3_um_filter_49_12]
MSTIALFYLFLPAFISNAAPVLVKNVPLLSKWNAPIHTKWFGAHKTWRGLLSGILFGVLVSLLQYALREAGVFAAITLLHSTPMQSVAVGFLLSFGALAGDAVESAVKRRMGFAPGTALPVWDGIDYMVGALVCLSPLYVPDVTGVLLLIVCAPLVSLVSNIFSYVVGWKDVWY